MNENEIVVPESSHGTQALDLLNEQHFAAIDRIATVMATAQSLVPSHLVGKKGDCFAVTMQAVRWKMDPFSVAQKTFLISGKLGYEAQLVAAVVNSCAPVQDRFHFEWYGPWENVLGKFITKTNKEGKPYVTPGWSPEDEKGCGVRVWATLKGESEPRVLPLLLQQATVRNSTQWGSDPKQQLAYLAQKKWARLYAPDVILGVYTPDEVEVKDITPSKKAPTEPKTGMSGLKSKLGVKSNSNKTESIEVKAETVEEIKRPLPSVLLANLIAEKGAPVTVPEIENEMRQRKILPPNGGLDQLDKWADKWVDYFYTKPEDFLTNFVKYILDKQDKDE